MFCTICGCQLKQEGSRNKDQNSEPIQQRGPKEVMEVGIPLMKKFIVIASILILGHICTQVIGGWIGIGLLVCLYFATIYVCKNILKVSLEKSALFVKQVFFLAICFLLIYSVAAYVKDANQKMTRYKDYKGNYVEWLEDFFSGDYKTAPDNKQDWISMEEFIFAANDEILNNPDKYLNESPVYVIGKIMDKREITEIADLPKDIKKQFRGSKCYLLNPTYKYDYSLDESSFIYLICNEDIELSLGKTITAYGTIVHVLPVKNLSFLAVCDVENLSE